MMSVDSNFNFLCGCPRGAWPLSPCRPHASTWAWPLPLRVDVTNGWPLSMLKTLLYRLLSTRQQCHTRALTDLNKDLWIH